MRQTQTQPQAIEIEEAVLGAILLEPDSLNKVAEGLKPEHFFKLQHVLIYKNIQQLYYDDEAIDILTLTDKLKKENELEKIGGPYAVVQLTNSVSSSANMEYHCRILEEKYINRQLIIIGDILMAEGYEDTDALENIDKAQTMLSEILTNKSDSVKDMKQLTDELMKHIDDVSKNEGKGVGIETGLFYYDEITGGLHKGDLIIIAGETSNGKTALSLNIGFNAGKNGYKVGLWSLEMQSLEMTIRAYSGETGINQTRMQINPLTVSEINTITNASETLSEQQVFIDDNAPNDYLHLRASIKGLCLKKGLDLVVIDYLQLIRHSGYKQGENNHLMVAAIANDLKALAKSLNIPIILVSQLSRNHSAPKPTLNRLKGSGDIEAAADVVWFTWMPKRYGLDSFQTESGEVGSENKAHLIVAKQRKGRTFDFAARFVGETTTFKNDLDNYTMPGESFDPAF